MRHLTALQLLDAWEQATGQPPVQRALVLIAAACPDEPIETLACLSIGQRDSRLLSLREWIFGAELSSIADCPACGERLEMTFRTSDLRVEPPTPGIDEYDLNQDGYQVHYRLPNSLDLLAAAREMGPENRRQLLLERCILAASQQDTPLPTAQLPPSVIAQVTEQIRTADPQADVELNLTCPACSYRWITSFDILAYFWSEIEVWANRILQEVHLLARAYGWSESAILSLSAWRRRRYLEMI